MKTIIKIKHVTTSDLERMETGSEALTLKQGQRERVQRSLWVDKEVWDAVACIAGTKHSTHEYIVLPVNDSSGNIHLKYYEVDAGPEEPKLEEYTGFYTDQESVTCDLGNSQFIFLEHYKPEFVYLSKVRQEDRWQVDGYQDRHEKIVGLMLC